MINKLNVPKIICKNLINKEHKFHHRAIVGIVMMVVGVCIAKTLGHHDEMPVAILADALGYSLHGIGLIPFIEALAEASV